MRCKVSHCKLTSNPCNFAPRRKTTKTPVCHHCRALLILGIVFRSGSFGAENARLLPVVGILLDLLHIYADDGLGTGKRSLI